MGQQSDGSFGPRWGAAAVRERLGSASMMVRHDNSIEPRLAIGEPVLPRPYPFARFDDPAQ